ncbi:hypothetical protein KAR91_79920 [Candidatus Pacearchaeota archaeon]|nr:hypothetical protein [Candidatus Pacearchaeota archaeon]
MSINKEGSVIYKTDELMKLTKAKLIERMVDLDKALENMLDGFKFDPTLDPYHRDNAERMRRIIHE